MTDKQDKPVKRHQLFAGLLSTVESLSAMGAAELIESLPPSECSFQAAPRDDGFDVVCLTHNNEVIHSRRTD